MHKKRMRNEKQLFLLFLILLSPLAVWTGLEPATPCVTGRYSNQLNYHTVYLSSLTLGGEAIGCVPIASAKLGPFFVPCKYFGNFFSRKMKIVCIG